MPNTNFQNTPGPLDSMRMIRERQLRVPKSRDPGDITAMQRGQVVNVPGAKVSAPRSAIDRLNQHRQQR